MKRKFLLALICAALLPGSIHRMVAGRARPAAATPAGASVKGMAKFEGTAPKPANLNMAADPVCAKAHASSPAIAEDLLTDGHGGLKNVIVYVSEGLGTATFTPPNEPAVLEQTGCQYKPHVFALMTGQKIKVLNNDATTHNIHPIPSVNRGWNESQPPGVPIEESFARVEIAIPVKCNIHPWMKGYIAVFNHPYFAVTGENGDFDLKDLPPGSYTLQAWHEKLGTTSQKVTVGAGETKTVEFMFGAK